MPEAEKSAARKALDYAENDLRVHAVHEDALKARNELDEILSELSKKRDEKRDVELRLQDREMEISADERGKHPDMSQAQMDKHLKVAYNRDDSVREYREQVARLTGDIEGLEYDKQMSETDIKIATARMNELSGYLQYLAVLKISQMRREAKDARPVISVSSPWD